MGWHREEHRDDFGWFHADGGFVTDTWYPFAEPLDMEWMLERLRELGFAYSRNYKDGSYCFNIYSDLHFPEITLEAQNDFEPYSVAAAIVYLCKEYPEALPHE